MSLTYFIDRISRLKVKRIAHGASEGATLIEEVLPMRQAGTKIQIIHFMSYLYTLPFTNDLEGADLGLLTLGAANRQYFKFNKFRYTKLLTLKIFPLVR